jgi:hypothetical protein
MLGVCKTDDPSRVPVMSVVDRQTAEETGRRPKLLDRLWDALRSRHHSRRTGETYRHRGKGLTQARRRAWRARFLCPCVCDATIEARACGKRWPIHR